MQEFQKKKVDELFARFEIRFTEYKNGHDPLHQNFSNHKVVVKDGNHHNYMRIDKEETMNVKDVESKKKKKPDAEVKLYSVTTNNEEELYDVVWP